MVASELNSDGWTGGAEPEPEKAKSRLERCADAHPWSFVVVGSLILAALKAWDVNTSWTGYSARFVAEAAYLAAFMAALFAGGFLLQWLVALATDRKREDLALFQKRYIFGLAFVSYLATLMIGPYAVTRAVYFIWGHL
jgi:hypothetical protein